MSLTTTVPAVYFLIKIMPIYEAVKWHFKRSDDKQNLTLMILSYEIQPGRVAQSVGHLTHTCDTSLIILETPGNEP